MTQAMQSSSKTLLIIGATGGIGGEVAKSFARGGWTVRALARKPKEAAKKFGHLGVVEWRKGDALKSKDVLKAARGVDAIFHGANPPGYQKWRERAVPMLANAIAAAKAEDVRLLFPGNVYNFGPDAWPLLSETSPQNPLTKKGAIRVEMEQMMEEAGIKSLTVRAGDFFGAHAPGSWLPNAIVKPGKEIKSVVYPGLHNKGHAWAYLPDLAETFRLLMGQEQRLDQNDVFHFRGHFFEQGVDMAKAIARVAGDESVKVKEIPWGLIRLVSPLVTMLREILEMRYLWKETVELDNAKLVAFLGEEPHTPLDSALMQSLEGMGCIKNPMSQSTPQEVPV